MSEDFLGDRKKALEESFFAKQNAALLDKMREERERQVVVDALAANSNISNRHTLKKLVDLGLDTATWAALSIVPLVEVAWADGEVDGRERAAVLDAAHEHGVEKGTPSHELLESWLEKRPASSLFASWGAYAAEISSNLSPAEREELRANLAERAESVARAAGGILGIGSISTPERRVLDALSTPFA
ncbi:MAG: hypothetical protein OEP95_09235 [Myxococcales bacterium]|nr:hypothetical protein [Myxococcales bacterium]